MGQCLRLDVNEFANVTGKAKLLIQFHINKSDSTVSARKVKQYCRIFNINHFYRDGHGYNFLTNGAINGMTIYPTHGIDNVILGRQVLYSTHTRTVIYCDFLGVILLKYSRTFLTFVL